MIVSSGKSKRVGVLLHSRWWYRSSKATFSRTEDSIEMCALRDVLRTVFIVICVETSHTVFGGQIGLFYVYFFWLYIYWLARCLLYLLPHDHDTQKFAFLTYLLEATRVDTRSAHYSVHTGGRWCQWLKLFTDKQSQRPADSYCDVCGRTICLRVDRHTTQVVPGLTSSYLHGSGGEKTG